MALSWPSHNEIHSTMVRVHMALNRADWESLAKLFEHAVLITRYEWSDTPLVAVGGRRIADGYRDTFRLHEGLPRVQYTLTNVLIDGDDQGPATAWSQYFAIAGNERTWHGPRAVDPERGADAARLEIFIAGRYEDEFTRIDGAWRLTRRTCHADFTGDRSSHLAVDPYDARTIDRLGDETT